MRGQNALCAFAVVLFVVAFLLVGSCELAELERGLP